MDNVQEIKRLLDERGADYDEYSRSRSHAFEIDYCDNCGDYLSEIEIFGACIYVTKKYLTPEQAVAVALGLGENEFGYYKEGEAMSNHRNEKKPPIEAKGDCAVCNGWKDDGRGGCCVFAADYWQPDCPYDKAVK